MQKKVKSWPQCYKPLHSLFADESGTECRERDEKNARNISLVCEKSRVETDYNIIKVYWFFCKAPFFR
jgi:hypothetical protein